LQVEVAVVAPQAEMQEQAAEVQVATEAELTLQQLQHLMQLLLALVELVTIELQNLLKVLIQHFLQLPQQVVAMALLLEQDLLVQVVLVAVELQTL
jgi:hypothetical protein